MTLTLDTQKITACSEQLFGDLNGAMRAMVVHLGTRLGLFEALASGGAQTAAEFAALAGCHERYCREWLAAVVTGGLVEHDPVTGRFTLPPEHAAVLVDHGHPAYAAPWLGFIPSFGDILTPLCEAFRTGGGVPYEAYGDACRDAIGHGNRPMFLHDLADRWMPALPDVVERLAAGGRVADIGCGTGWSSIALARAFPGAHIDALDADAASAADARRNVDSEGLGHRITVHHAYAEDGTLEGPYDLVTAFECIHDLPYPVRVLERLRTLAAPDGVVLIADEKVEETLEANCNFTGNLMYNFSVLHCLPQAMTVPESAGTGTAMSVSTLQEYAAAAGFSRAEVLPIDHELWRFYRLRV
ncbi:MAG: class I SAM-dependent methyltransferase [Planctomycetota bacterium]|jgi:2-polyprenyl-3-methyl-5-hydroxy-6-metoxy-1,4-benzoquinol methylase